MEAARPEFWNACISKLETNWTLSSAHAYRGVDPPPFQAVL